MVEPMQLTFLGPGVPLFFLFQKYVILLLLIMTIVFMGFSIYSNIDAGDCGKNNKCITDVFNMLAIVNKGTNTLYLTIQSYLTLLFLIVTVLFLHLFRFKARKLEQKCD